MPRIEKEDLVCQLILKLTDDCTWDEQIRVICDVFDGPPYPSTPHLIHQLFGQEA